MSVRTSNFEGSAAARTRQPRAVSGPRRSLLFALLSLWVVRLDDLSSSVIVLHSAVLSSCRSCLSLQLSLPRCTDSLFCCTALDLRGSVVLSGPVHGTLAVTLSRDINLTSVVLSPLHIDQITAAMAHHGRSPRPIAARRASPSLLPRAPPIPVHRLPLLGSSSSSSSQGPTVARRAPEPESTCGPDDTSGACERSSSDPGKLTIPIALAIVYVS